jgi:hypothetical protein
MSRILFYRQAIPILIIVIFSTFTKTHKKVETKNKLGKSTLKINIEKKHLRECKTAIKGHKRTNFIIIAILGTILMHIVG